jgi:hypothetical protein
MSSSRLKLVFRQAMMILGMKTSLSGKNVLVTLFGGSVALLTAKISLLSLLIMISWILGHDFDFYVEELLQAFTLLIGGT